MVVRPHSRPSRGHPGIDALLDLPKAKSERPQHRQRDLWTVQQEGPEVVGVDLQDVHRFDGPNRGHPPVGGDERHLAENGPSTEPVESASDVNLRWVGVGRFLSFFVVLRDLRRVSA